MNKNIQAQTETMGSLYLGVLKSREGLDLGVVPSDNIETLTAALDNSLRIIENLALLTAATEANLVAVFRKLDTLGDDPVMGERITHEFKDLVALKEQVVDQAFSDVVVFARQFQTMVQDSIVLKAGIDPRDQEAVQAYLIKMGRSLVLVPPNTSN